MRVTSTPQSQAGPVSTETLESWRAQKRSDSTIADYMAQTNPSFAAQYNRIKQASGGDPRAATAFLNTRFYGDAYYQKPIPAEKNKGIMSYPARVIDNVWEGWKRSAIDMAQIEEKAEAGQMSNLNQFAQQFGQSALMVGKALSAPWTEAFETRAFNTLPSVMDIATPVVQGIAEPLMQSNFAQEVVMPAAQDYMAYSEQSPTLQSVNQLAVGGGSLAAGIMGINPMLSVSRALAHPITTATQTIPTKIGQGIGKTLSAGKNAYAGVKQGLGYGKPPASMTAYVAPTLANGGIIARGELKPGARVIIKASQGDDIVGTVEEIGYRPTGTTAKSGNAQTIVDTSGQSGQKFIYVKNAAGQTEQISLQGNFEIYNADFNPSIGASSQLGGKAAEFVKKGGNQLFANDVATMNEAERALAKRMTLAAEKAARTTLKGTKIPKTIAGEQLLLPAKHIIEHKQAVGKALGNVVDSMAGEVVDFTDDATRVFQAMSDKGVIFSRKTGKIISAAGVPDSELPLLQKIADFFQPDDTGRVIRDFRESHLFRQKIFKEIDAAKAALSPTKEGQSVFDISEAIANEARDAMIARMSELNTSYGSYSVAYKQLTTEAAPFYKLIGYKGYLDDIDVHALGTGEAAMLTLGSRSADKVKAIDDMIALAERYGYESNVDPRKLVDYVSALDNIYPLQAPEALAGQVRKGLSAADLASPKQAGFKAALHKIDAAYQHFRGMTLENRTKLLLELLDEPPNVSLVTVAEKALPRADYAQFMDDVSRDVKVGDVDIGKMATSVLDDATRNLANPAQTTDPIEAIARQSGQATTELGLPLSDDLAQKFPNLTPDEIARLTPEERATGILGGGGDKAPRTTSKQPQTQKSVNGGSVGGVKAGQAIGRENAQAMVDRATDIIRRNYEEAGIIRPDVIEKNTSRFLDFLAGDKKAGQQLLATSNPTSRKIFEEITGITLPKTVGGTRELVEKFNFSDVKVANRLLNTVDESPKALPRDGATTGMGGSDSVGGGVDVSGLAPSLDSPTFRNGFVVGDTVTMPTGTFKVGDTIDLGMAGAPPKFPKPWKLKSAINEPSSVDGANHVTMKIEAANGKIMDFKNTEIYSPSSPSPLPKSIGGSDTLEPLMKEARKYKSADEFVKAQGETLYHGTNEVFDRFDLSKARFKGEQGDNLWGFGVYTSPNRGTASQYGKNVLEIPFTPKKPLDLSRFKTTTELADYLDMSEDALVMRNGMPTAKGQQAAQFSSKAKMLGHDVIVAGQETVILEPSNIRTKSQLTDLWKKAHDSSPSN